MNGTASGIAINCTPGPQLIYREGFMEENKIMFTVSVDLEKARLCACCEAIYDGEIFGCCPVCTEPQYFQVRKAIPSMKGSCFATALDVLMSKETPDERKQKCQIELQERNRVSQAQDDGLDNVLLISGDTVYVQYPIGFNRDMGLLPLDTRSVNQENCQAGKG